MYLSVINQFLIAAFAGFVLWAAANDARHFIIPNCLSAAIAVLWLGFAMTALAAGKASGPYAIAFVIGFASFAAGFLLFALRLVGGGDVKLFAAVALWAGPDHLGLLLAVTLITGGILAAGYLAARVLRTMTMQGAPGFGVAVMAALRSEVPFGLAIAAGGLIVATRLFFGVSAP